MAVNLHPGWVKTDLGTLFNCSEKFWCLWFVTFTGGPKAPMEIEQSCDSMVNTIINLDQSHNGGFFQYDGKALPW